MKYIVSEHGKTPDSEIIEALEKGDHEYSRFDLTTKAVMWYLYVELELTNKEIYDYLCKRTEGRFTQNDVTMSLRWWGLLPSSGTPLQARASSIAEVLSFGHEL